MKLTTGILLLLVALGPLGLGLLWFVGAAGGGEWDLRLAGSVIDGLVVGSALIAVGVVLVAVGVRLIRTPNRFSRMHP
jgi:uncharacterized protein (DUF697 family)